MDQPNASDLCLRLCECKPGDVLAPSTAARGGHPAVGGAPTAGVPLGTAVAAKWDPTHPRRLGVLFSSGVLRLWDVIDNSSRDFALYIPANGLPMTAAPSAVLNIQSRRAAAPITFFEFVPLTNASAHPGLPRIVFTCRRSRQLYMADIPPATATNATGGPLFSLPTPAGHYIAGSRVYECAARLVAEASAMCAWLVAGGEQAVAAIAVGCVNGDVHVWLMSGAFNPATIVSMRSRRTASPGLLHACVARAGPVATSGTSAVSDVAASTLDNPSHMTQAAAHTRRVRLLAPVMTLSVEEAALSNPLLPPASPYSATRLPCQLGNTLFISSAEDGQVHMWRLCISFQDAASTHVRALTSSLLAPPGTEERPLTVSVSHMLRFPCDSVQVTAVTSIPWRLQASTIAAMTAGLPVRAGSPRDAQPARALVALGNVEGSLTLWECMIHAHHLLLPAAAHTSLPPPTLPFAGNATVVLPSVRMVGMTHAVHVDPLAALSLTSPLNDVDADGMLRLAAASVDGTLRVYRLHGTQTPAAGLPSPDESNAAVSVEQVGEVAAPAATHGSAFDVIVQSAPEATALRHLAAASTSTGGEAPSIMSSGYAADSAAVATALTLAAVAELRKAFVSCAFNDTAACFRAHADDLGASVSMAALMACNGAGDIMLWPRTALPGAALHVPQSTERAATPSSHPEADRSTAGGTVADPANNVSFASSTISRAQLSVAPRPNVHAVDALCAQPIADNARAVAGTTESRDASDHASSHNVGGTCNSPPTSVAFEPETSGAREADFQVHARHTDNASGGEDDVPPRPRSPLFDVAAALPSRPSSFSAWRQRVAHDNGGEGEYTLEFSPAALSHTDSSRAKIVRATRSPASVGRFVPASPTPAAISFSAPATPGGGARGRSRTPPAVRAAAVAAVARAYGAPLPAPPHAAALSQSPHDAATDAHAPRLSNRVHAVGASAVAADDPGAQDSSSAMYGGASSLDYSAAAFLHTPGAAIAASPSPRSMTGRRSSAGTATASAALPAAFVAAVLQTRAAGGGVPMAASEDNGSGVRGGHGSRSTSRPQMLDGFRNPARVSAILRNDSANVVAVQTGSLAQHASMLGVFARVTSAGGGPADAACAEGGIANHYVAPVTGSTAAIASEIARLEAATFNEEAAMKSIFSQLRITDRRVIAAVQERVRSRSRSRSQPRQGGTAGSACSSLRARATPGSKQPGGASPAAATAQTEGTRSIQLPPTVSGEEFVYMPGARVSSARAGGTSGRGRAAPRCATARATAPVPALRPIVPSTTPALERLLQPTEARRQAGKTADHVTASDFLNWHGGLRSDSTPTRRGAGETGARRNGGGIRTRPSRTALPPPAPTAAAPAPIPTAA